MATNAELTTQCLADIQRYASDATEAQVATMIKSYGLVMRKADTRTVACSDQTEKNRVRENYLKKKLAVSGSNDALDAMVNRVCDEMKGDRSKNRVTFYYLLAKHTGNLGVFA